VQRLVIRSTYVLLCTIVAVCIVSAAPLAMHRCMRLLPRLCWGQSSTGPCVPTRSHLLCAALLQRCGRPGWRHHVSLRACSCEVRVRVSMMVAALCLVRSLPMQLLAPLCRLPFHNVRQGERPCKLTEPGAPGRWPSEESLKMVSRSHHRSDPAPLWILWSCRCTRRPASSCC
jgi:hypothetical protein